MFPSAKMAANFLPGHEDLLDKFNDTGSKDKSENFDLEDQDKSVIWQQSDGLSIKNWTEGDRKPTALPLTVIPGLTTKATL